MTVYLKEDGSLDVERINQLPLEEWMDMVGEMTSEQFAYLESKTPINECKGEGTKVVILDESFDQGIDADVFLNNRRKELGSK